MKVYEGYGEGGTASRSQIGSRSIGRDWIKRRSLIGLERVWRCKDEGEVEDEESVDSMWSCMPSHPVMLWSHSSLVYIEIHADLLSSSALSMTSHTEIQLPSGMMIMKEHK